MILDDTSVYSAFNPDSGLLAFLRPSTPRTLGSAARLERDIMLKVREIFPEWHEYLLQGEPKRLVPIKLDDQAAFIDLFVKMRRTHPLANYHDVDSATYTPDSIPNLYTSLSSFWMPHPKKPLKPYENKTIAWHSNFSLGGNGGYELCEISPTLGIEKRPEGMRKVRELFEYCIERFDPFDANFKNWLFRKIALENFSQIHSLNRQIGFLNYFAHPPLVEHLLKDSRAEPFHKGVILQLSEDPYDMSNEQFIHSCSDFINSLAPYWPEAIV